MGRAGGRGRAATRSHVAGGKRRGASFRTTRWRRPRFLSLPPRTGWRGEKRAPRGGGARPAPSGCRETEAVGDGPGRPRLLASPSVRTARWRPGAAPLPLLRGARAGGARERRWFRRRRRASSRPPMPRCSPAPASPAARPPPAMAASARGDERDSDGGSVIVLDDEEEEEEEEERREEEEEGGGPGPAPAERDRAPPDRPPGAPDPRKPGPGKDAAALRARNGRLFGEFLAFCSEHTLDHPEVMSYLASRHQKTSPDFLASVEFHNVLSRCLARVKARQSKIYVYINELCTVFRAHSQKKKPPPAPGTPPASATPASPSEQPAPEGAKPRAASRRRIQDLENLLRVYSKEIRRLQERELDLAELDRADSAYLLEGRLKRRMMRVFQRLCELKDCSGLTGRVIEQRIPYRGTRYPEVNRRIERLINRPGAFPDYADILRVVQRASAGHGLGLPKRQMESLAASAFREVGDLLQERRHLDLIYNFGSHLTDEYRPNTDPALGDGELARRLRQNRALSLRRLEEVTAHFAQLQEKAEEAQWGRPGGRPRAGPSGAPGRPRGQPLSPRKPGRQGSPAPTAGGKEAEEEEEDEEDDEDEEEEEEESSSSELDVDAELQKCLGGEGPVPEDGPPAPEMEADQRMRLSSSTEDPEEEEDEDEDEEEDEEEEEEESEGDVEAEGGRPPPSPPDQPPTPGAAPERLLLALGEALTLEAGETPPPSPKPSPPRRAEPGGALPLPEQRPPKRAWSPEAGAPLPADITTLRGLNGQPRGKRARPEHRVSHSSCIEVPSTGSSEEDEADEEGGGGAPGRPPPRPSPAPVADSTCADSPGAGLVSSSQGSPQPLLLQASVATQCDPEEIIVLSDSD